MRAEDITGQVVSHYRIDECIGQGGMGVVYRAFDLRLERAVALKMLAPAALSTPGVKGRFKREARSASAINHPNIAQVYEIDEAGSICFIAMELVEGETLAAIISATALDEALALHLAKQIAAAMMAAHSRGIIHRDIKPTNILVTAGNQVKVLDFGLAKVFDTGAGETRSQTLTSADVIMGTVDYMSPEQALGRDLDPRSDVFSFGVVLYQMVTGVLPFRGRNSTEVLAQVLQGQPASAAESNPSITPGLERVIARCLAKDPADRYQSMEEIVLDLGSLSGELPPAAFVTARKTPLIQKRYWVAAAAILLCAAAVLLAVGLYRHFASGYLDSLAVLPLVNGSGDATLDYFSDGISESVINRVSRVRSVTVRPRSAVIRYKGKEVDPRTVGRALKVKAVLTGRMRVENGNLLIGVELTDIANDRQLWGEQYQRSPAGVYEIQEEISREVTRSLRAPVSAEDRQLLARQDTRSTEAYQLYLKGRYFWNKRTADGLVKAIDYFQQAIAADPGYALAYSGLADCYILQGNMIRPTDIFPKAKAAVMKALEQDPHLAEPYATLGYIRLHFDWNWAEAEDAFRRALERNPNYPTAHSMYARYLTARGRFEQALDEMKRAQELDPLALGIGAGIGLCYYYAGQYDRAIEQYRKTLEIDSSFALAHFDLGSALGRKQRFNEAIAEFEAGFKVSPNDAGAAAELGNVYARAKRDQEARQVLNKLQEISRSRYVSPFFPALVHAGRGDPDQALANLEKAFEERSSPMAFLNVEPGFVELRSDPRFQGLLRRMQLAEDKPRPPDR
jgi:TolB-like protein/Tfp pilus assembly protein PilF